MGLRSLVLLVLICVPQVRGAQAPPKAASFTTPYTLAEMTGKQAVIETTKGSFVFELLPNLAPNHVGFFMKQARDGSYNGTTFHRVIRLGIIQGGDPLSRDPAKSSQYGTGGMNLLKRELSKESHTIGTVSAVLAPGQPDSGGFQFFVCASPQVALDGQYTIFGRVVDGIEVVQAISTVDADEKGMAKERVVIKTVTIRDTPPPVKAWPRWRKRERCSTPPQARSKSSSSRTRRQKPFAIFCSSRRQACSMTRSSIAWCRIS
jgi:cyclophilin family peptidyl-prolyl cis-trans isomerase